MGPMMKQMTFGQLLNTAQTDGKPPLVLNPTVPAEAAPRLKHQAKAILEALNRGPLWTNDLNRIARQYNARIKELRDHLRPQGLTIDMTARGADGNNRYEIKPLVGSHYQAEQMRKQGIGR